MIGSNTLILNKAEMIRAVGFYLDEIQLKEPIKITSVTEKDNLFYVVFQEVSDEKKEG